MCIFILAQELFNICIKYRRLVMLTVEIRQLKVIVVSMIMLMTFVTSCDTTEPESTSLSLSLKKDSELLKSSAEGFQIQKVKLLLRDIKIKNQAKDNELQVKTGPLVVNLDMDGKVTEFASSEIPEGSYDRVRFEIHKIQDTEKCPDPEFMEGDDSSQRYSLIVNGTLNGETFTYRSRKSAEQDIELTEEIVVEKNENANLTITVDPYSWFYEGDTFLNPNDSANDDKIDNNLKYAFKRAYCDCNQDGIID